MLIEHATIVGCGWIGLTLAERWVGRGVEVVGTTTQEEKVSELSALDIQGLCIGPHASWELLPSERELLVITVPPGRRYPERLAAYPERMLSLARRVEPAAKVIYLSSTGVYGDARGDVDEMSLAQPVTRSAQAVLEVEHALRSELGERLTVLRLGGLAGPDRHPGRWFAGKQDAAEGDAPVNLVHRDDVCDAVDAVVEHDAFGAVFNVVAHEHPTKRAYYTDICARFGYAAPTFLDGGADNKRVVADAISAIMKRRIELPFAHVRGELAQ